MAVEKLRELVVRKFGKPVANHYDAVQLQESILKESSKRLSTQTIKRFFGLIKSSSRQDPSTLDAFASFLQFASFKDFASWDALSKPNTGNEQHDWASEIVLQVLKDIHPEYLHEKGLLQLVKNLFTLFERHPNLTSTIYPKLAASKFGRRFFFEQFVHYDALAHHYGMGLEHFLLHENEKPARTFGYSMLCLRDFLMNNNEGCKYYYQKVMSFPYEQVKTWHPFVVGRYHSSQLYMKYINCRNSTEYIRVQCERMLADERCTDDIYAGFPCSELVFAEALIFTGHFSQAYDLLNHEKVKEYTHPPNMDEAFKNHLEVLRTFSGVYADRLTPARAVKELERIDQSPVYFLCHNYTNLFIQLAKARCNINPRVSLAKAEECLRALGFNRLRFYFYQ